jgi:hypothetical protein
MNENVSLLLFVSLFLSKYLILSIPLFSVLPLTPRIDRLVANSVTDGKVKIYSKQGLRASPAGRRILLTQMVRSGPLAPRAGHNLHRGPARQAGARRGVTHPIRR